MALIVEDGTGLANAESYVSVAYADAYFTARNNANWDGNDAHKEGLLRIATEYLDANYGQRFKGIKNTEAQALQWPRFGVCVDGYDIGNDVIPVEVMRATCELALRQNHNTDGIQPDLSQTVKREKIDVIEVEYSEYSPQSPQYKQVDSLLAKYLQGGKGSMRVIRT